MKHKKVKEKQLILISKSLSQMYKDGIPIRESLDLIRDVITNKEYKRSLDKVIVSTKEGKSISESFKEFGELYPSFFTGLISIGENTGKLYEVLTGISKFYEKYLYITNEIKSACIYPLFILFSLFALSIFLINKINPSFYEIYNSMNINPPKSCIFLYSINEKFQTDFTLATITMVCWLIIVGIVINLIKKNIKLERLYEIKIVKDTMEYMTILIFSIICSTGINISYALNYCSDSVSPQYLNDKLKEINKNILRGQTLSESLKRSKVISKYSLSLIRIREETGSISEGFNELSKNLENNLSKKIKKYLSFLNPIFVVIMSFCIMSFLIVFVLPLFDSLQKGMIR